MVGRVRVHAQESTHALIPYPSTRTHALMSAHTNTTSGTTSTTTTIKLFCNKHQTNTNASITTFVATSLDSNNNDYNDGHDGTSMDMGHTACKNVCVFFFLPRVYLLVPLQGCQISMAAPPPGDCGSLPLQMSAAASGCRCVWQPPLQVTAAAPPSRCVRQPEAAINHSRPEGTQQVVKQDCSKNIYFMVDA